MPTVPQRYRRTDGRLTIAIQRFVLRASRGNNNALSVLKPNNLQRLALYRRPASDYAG